MKIKIKNKYKSKIFKLKSTKLFKKDTKVFKNIFNLPNITILNNLLKIQGINISSALFLINYLGISPFILSKKLLKIQSFIKKELYLFSSKKKLILENNVFLLRKQNVRHLKNIANIRGIKHINFLPVNGQKTYSNAKTRKKYKII